MHICRSEVFVLNMIHCNMGELDANPYYPLPQELNADSHAVSTKLEFFSVVLGGAKVEKRSKN